MILALTLLTGMPAEAGPYTGRDWSIITSFAPECPSTWSDLITAKQPKAGISGNDTTSEYVIGSVGTGNPPLSLTLYDISTHAVIGDAKAWTTGAESYSGDVVDIKPVFFASSCSNPIYAPRYFVRVYTWDGFTSNDFLAYVY